MESLKELIQCLDKAEVTLVENYFKFQNDKNNGKRLKLFRLVRDNKVDNDVQAARKIYQSAPTSAYSHLKTRLRENIINLLFPNYFKEEGNAYSRGKYECWRLLMLGQFLLSREAYSEAERNLKLALDLSKQYNLTVEKIMIDDLLTNQLSMIKKEQKKESLAPDMKQELGDLQRIMQAKKLYNKLYIADLFNTGNPDDLWQESTPILEQVKDLFERENSAEAGYWYYNLSSLINRMCDNVPHALQFALSQFELVEEDPTLFTFSRKINARLQVGKMYLYNQQPTAAKQIIEEAMDLANPETLIYLDLIEVLFQIHLYDDNIEMAEMLMEQALAHPKLEVSRLASVKWMFYRANLEFRLGNYNASLELLFENKELLRYKSKWLFGYKVLEILNFIELGKLDLVEYRVNAFKQLLKRQSKGNTDRCKYLCRVFGLVIKHNFDATQALPVYFEKLEQMPQSVNTWQWKPFGFEIVNVDRWMTSKQLHEMAQ